MGLRDPKDKIAELAGEFSLDRTLQDLDEQAQSAEQGKWQSYKIEVITPIFGGGVKAGVPDTQMPIRASAIRGQLRYWWRFLAKAEHKDWSDEKLFEKERDIWGGMAEEGEDFSSKVKLRIQITSFNNKTDIRPCAEYHENYRRPGEYATLPVYDNTVSEYAMFPGRGKLLSSDKSIIEEKPADLIFHLQFVLKILVEKNDVSFEQEVEPTLRWWLTFGGLGSRTRRGCGSLHCADLLPVTEKEAEDAGCKLVFPRNYSPGKAIRAWKKSVDILQKFRQLSPVRNSKGGIIDWVGIGRNKKKGKTPGRSKWPEPDSIRQIMDTYSKEESGYKCKSHEPQRDASKIAFPRAAFGLPIIFKFKDEKCGDPQQTELSPANSERLASPLILTAYPIYTNGTVRYAPAALLIGNRQHIETAELSLADKNKKLWVTPTDKKKKSEWQANGWDQWPNDWQNKRKIQDVDPIKDNKGTDALTAFMNFFAKGGA